MRPIRLFVSLLTLLSTGVFARGSTAQAQSAGRNPGDQLRIAVWRSPEFSGDFTIAANGTINHPLYREIQVTGIPITTVEDRLRTFLTRYMTNPQFVIQPLVKIVVAGEVKAPNIYSVPPETTVAQAVALAGGPTDRGRLDQIMIVRDKEELKVDLTKPQTDAGQVPIRSGDQILVGRGGAPFRDYVAPVASSIAAIAATITIFRR